MAVLHHDELEEILGKKFSTYRNQIWLWHFLDNPFGTLHQGAFGPGARDCMARHLKNRPELKNSIFNSVGESFLPDVEFDWIGGGERQNEFVLKDMTGGDRDRNIVAAICYIPIFSVVISIVILLVEKEDKFIHGIVMGCDL